MIGNPQHGYIIKRIKITLSNTPFSYGLNIFCFAYFITDIRNKSSKIGTRIINVAQGLNNSFII